MRKRITAVAIALAWSSVLLAGCTETPTVPPVATEPSLVTDFSASTAADYKQLSAGWFHTCALKTDGSLACWGGDIAGAVSATPPGANFVQVSAGAYFTCALKMDGSLVCWGFNGAGQTLPPGGNNFTQVSSGGSHACAFKTDGSLTCWGDNSHGEATPPAGSSFVQVTTGNSHTCALKTDGSLACWGDNTEGQATPPGGTNFAQVSAGASHTCAVRTDGSLACWGRNLEGQATPPSGATFAQVSGGYSHTCAVRTDGSLACWGSNLSGQAAPPAGANFAKVSAGAAHTCALKTDGSPACWGDNYYGQATPPLNALLDQEQPIIDASDGTLAIGGESNQLLAQVVTPTVSGSLAEVRFPVGCSSSGLIVEVQGVVGGVPDGVVLASRLVDGSTLPSPVPSSFRSLVFTTRPTVSAGVPYAIVLRSPGSCGVFPGPTGDPYQGGDAFFDARPNPPGWLPLTSRRDLPFQTFVAPNQTTPPPVTPQAAIQLLMGNVRALVSQGVLSLGQGNGLLAKLTAAIPSLDNGRTNAGCNQLRAFVNQVNGLIRARKLSAGAGQELIDAAESIRSQLGCVGSLADLTIGQLAETPANPTSGNIITLSGVVSNSGGTAAGPSTVSLCATQFFPGGGSGATCQVFQGPGVSAGGSAQVSATIGTLLPGTYTITASVDTFNVVPESNEANNQTIGPSFTVVAPNSWTGVTPMPTPRFGLAVGVNGGMAYAFGGAGIAALPPVSLATVEGYDPATGAWTTKAPMPTARDLLGVASVDGVLYAVGGFSNGVPVATVEAYNPVTNTWTAKTAMPTARGGLGVASIGGILYAVGGVTGSNLSNVVGTAEAYDPVTDTWMTIAPMPTAREGLGVAALNGILYTVGGVTSSGALVATVEAYDPATNTWTEKTFMPTARGFLGMAAIDGVIYAVGGFASNGGIVANVEAYNPTTDSWTTTTSLPTPRYLLGVAATAGMLFAIGGNGVGGVGSSGLATVDAYRP